MKTVGSFEAKTKLAELLRAVEERQDEIIITRHNRKIARLIPFDDTRGKSRGKADILEGFRKIREKQAALKPDALRKMIDEGRKR